MPSQTALIEKKLTTVFIRNHADAADKHIFLAIHVTYSHRIRL